MASDPIAVEFRDGKYRAAGTVTFSLGEPIRVNGKLRAPVFADADLVAVEESE